MLRAWVTLNFSSNDTPPYKSEVEVKVVDLRPTEYMYNLLIKKNCFMHGWYTGMGPFLILHFVLFLFAGILEFRMQAFLMDVCRVAKNTTWYSKNFYIIIDSLLPKEKSRWMDERLQLILLMN